MFYDRSKIIQLSELGAKHLYAGHYQEAEKCFRAIINYDNAHNLGLSEAHDKQRYNNNNSEPSQPIGNANAMANLGLCLSHQKKDEEAISWFDLALTIKPSNPDILLNKGVSCTTLAQKPDLNQKAKKTYLATALDCYNKILQQNPNDALALSNKATVLLLQGYYQLAFTAIEQALHSVTNDKFKQPMLQKKEILLKLIGNQPSSTTEPPTAKP